MLRYGPSLLVLVGACIVAAGTFWSGYRQSSFNADLRDKNDTIQKLQSEALIYQKGGTDCILVATEEVGQPGRYQLILFNRNDVPLYDLNLNIRSNVDMPVTTDEQLQKALPFILHRDRYNLGNIGPQRALTTEIFLSPGYYQINIITRSGRLTEMLKFGPFNGRLGQSYSVTDFTGRKIAQSTSPEEFGKIY